MAFKNLQKALSNIGCTLTSDPVRCSVVDYNLLFTANSMFLYCPTISACANGHLAANAYKPGQVIFSYL